MIGYLLIWYKNKIINAKKMSQQKKMVINRWLLIHNLVMLSSAWYNIFHIGAKLPFLVQNAVITPNNSSQSSSPFLYFFNSSFTILIILTTLSIFWLFCGRHINDTFEFADRFTIKWTMMQIQTLIFFHSSLGQRLNLLDQQHPQI